MSQVAADLGQPGGYLDQIDKATADIDVQLVFCNAGYVLAGFVEKRYLVSSCPAACTLSQQVDLYLQECGRSCSQHRVQLHKCNASCLPFLHATGTILLITHATCCCCCITSCSHQCWCVQIDKKLKGCIVFTSSAAASIPSPFGAIYAATKCFISAFGAGLAPEVKHHGIDVLVAHPSPVASR